MRPHPETGLAAHRISVLLYLAKPMHLPLLVGSILFNCGSARPWLHVRTSKRANGFFQFGLVVNVALLCSVKYTHFILGPLVSLWNPHFTLPAWEFPLGVSFFTLTQVMYLVDTYQNQNRPNSLFDHATFVSLFRMSPLVPWCRPLAGTSTS